LVLASVLIAMVGLAVANCQDGVEAVQSPADRRFEALSQELDLNGEQRARLENVRDLVHERRDELRTEREAHAAELLEAIEAGQIDHEGVHGLIDAKADQLRTTAHLVADELIALIESMDGDQRARLVERLETMHARMQEFHDRMESAEGGPHQALMQCLAEQGFSPTGWLHGAE
jgi:hypothetical protein